jgi:hypothetical protein
MQILEFGRLQRGRQVASDGGEARQQLPASLSGLRYDSEQVLYSKKFVKNHLYNYYINQTGRI